MLFSMKGWEVKHHLLMSSKRSLNEALIQTLKPEAVKAAAGPPVKQGNIED
jgi:hypothetical protein